MPVILATYLFITLVTVVIVFQLALTLGMPWGHLTMGGKFEGKLPARMRVVSALSAFILVLFGLIVATAGGLLLPEWYELAAKAIWVVVAYCVMGVLANAVTPSKWERIIWLPVVSLMLVCSLMVALG